MLDTTEPYYQSYKYLPSKSLRLMLAYEGQNIGDTIRFDIIRYLLEQPRTYQFRIGKNRIEKKL